MYPLSVCAGVDRCVDQATKPGVAGMMAVANKAAEIPIETMAANRFWLALRVSIGGLLEVGLRVLRCVPLHANNIAPPVPNLLSLMIS